MVHILGSASSWAKFLHRSHSFKLFYDTTYVVQQTSNNYSRIGIYCITTAQSNKSADKTGVPYTEKNQNFTFPGSINSGDLWTLTGEKSNFDQLFKFWLSDPGFWLPIFILFQNKSLPMRKLAEKAIHFLRFIIF